MTERIAAVAVAAAMAVAMAAMPRVFMLEGKVGGKYPIKMELIKYEHDYISGRYAYVSTLNRLGYDTCSWLSICPGRDDEGMAWATFDCDYKLQEHWWDVKFDGYALTARMKNAKGDVYGVEANVVGSSPGPDNMAELFRSFLGDYAFDMGMFSRPEIKARLTKMMGREAFALFKSIMDVQTPIEYHDGMYYSKGFVSHECCDPYALWAYDTSSGRFYVWILKDGQEYWWSESGEVSFAFKQLADS